MAVKVSEYYSRYRSETIALTMLAQVFTSSVAGALAWFLWQYSGLDPLSAFTYSLIGLIVVQVLATPVIVGLISKPLRVLWQAIAHVSNDSVQVKPPLINTAQYEKSGLKALVQTVYDLAVHPRTDIPTGAAPADNDLYRVLTQQMPVGVIALNPSTEVTFANPQAPAHQGSDQRTVIELIFEQSDTLDAWLASCQDKLRDTKIWRRVPNKMPDEEGRRIFDVIGYYRKRGEQGVETILVTIDRSNEYAPQEEDMDFIALAAHELRGPITVIRGYLELLTQELANITPQEQQLIERLLVSSERLSGYVNNILNVSRYDRNHLKLRLQEERLVDVVTLLVPDLALRAKTQNRKLTFHVPDSLPTIAADRSSLSEVISNLIDNAIKYSKDGGEVVVDAAVKNNFVEVTVQDFGMGMPGSVVGNLFNKFYRSHRSRQTVSGTGLGLYICKAIVESHGGSIWVRSVEGEGTTFGFTIPIYNTVADKLGAGDNGNEKIIERADGWIKNHAMFRR
jgi:two-component system phosphate regulon sensor histidine kinase PhoR/two-component system sensor histidine kinase VicK